MSTTYRALPAGSRRMMIRHVLPSALRCFFHVYEEQIGRYGLLVLKHVLVAPGLLGCNFIVDPHAYVTITNDIIVDRTWCNACAAVVAAETKRGHAPTPPEQIIARPVVHPLMREVL